MAASRRLAHQLSGTAEAMSTAQSAGAPRRHNTTPTRTRHGSVATARRMYCCLAAGSHLRATLSPICARDSLVSRQGSSPQAVVAFTDPASAAYGTGLLLRSVDGGGLGQN